MADMASITAATIQKFNCIKTGLGTQKKFPVISSGSLLIDTLTGIGGFPKGRVIELSGREGTGKCVSLDTLVYTHTGILTMGEIIENAKILVDGLGDGEAISLKVMLKGRQNRLLATTHYYNAGKLPTVIVHTFDGHMITGKQDHRVLGLDQRGRLAWRMLDTLEQRDYLVITGNQQSAMSGQIDDDRVYKATIDGILAGTKEMPDGTRLKIVGKECQDQTVAILQDKWDNEVVVTDFTGMTGEVQLTDEVEEYITENGLREGVPRSVRMGQKEEQWAYLRALCKTRMLREGGNVELVVYNRKLAQEIQILSET